MWEIIANIGMTGEIFLHLSKRMPHLDLLGFKEGIVITFNYYTSTFKGKEALKSLGQLIKKQNISWINTDRDRWIFNLDKLKESFSELSEAEWLSGEVTLEPDSEGKIITFYIIPEEIRRKRLNIKHPSAIEESLQLFEKDYPLHEKVAFIMMQYGENETYEDILKAIKGTLSKYEIKGVIAKDKEYHDDLYYNILTYIYRCDFGIAVFERIEKEEFNPNVSLEVGHLLALSKPVCLLKDKTLKSLQTDILGKIYRGFDTRKPEETISKVLTKWMEDKHII